MSRRPPQSPPAPSRTISTARTPSWKPPSPKAVQGILDSIPDADTISDDFLARLLDFLPHNEARRVEWKVWLSFWARAMSDERLRAQHGLHYRRVVTALADLLAALEAKGRIAMVAAPGVIADAVVAAVDGLSIRYRSSSPTTGRSTARSPPCLCSSIHS